MCATENCSKLSPNRLWSNAATRNWRPWMRALLIALFALVALPSAAQAQVQVQIDPSIVRQIQRVPTAPPSVVALGDSAISGEAGRWAGNTNQASSKTDALGSTAYNDVPGAESTPGCHRSKSAEVHIGDGVKSANISCSGARTYSRFSDGKFKPGIDFYSNGASRARRSTQGVRRRQQREGRRGADRGQRLRVRGHPRDLRDELADVAVVVEELLPGRREHGPDVLGVEHQQDHERRQGRVPERQDGDDQAGYDDGDYEILAQTYSAPLPLSGGFRYPETGFTRQTIGGCGTWNSDANWARNTVVNTLNNTIKNAVAGCRTSRCWTWSARSTAAACARTPSACSRRRASRPGRARAPSTRPSGCSRSARSRRSSRRTSCRRTGTRTTGASSRCATASGRPTTPERLRAATARAAPGSTARANPI